MRVIVDMNLSPRGSRVLIEAGLEVVRWSNIGRSDAPHVDIIAHAAEQDFVILTHDLDFGAILAITGGRSSQCRSNPG
jgi:predicted nuclease of predicted toxin-antitoxin system